ncbi:MAG TPA: T9SS type A sorting domain-containing protein, partial [Rhodothermales bacterium]|nr:T9SS type A sorting domain-containing protein [Rhodothermales bacterium]
IAKYSPVNNTWSSLGSGIGRSGYVYALAVLDSDLYVGGGFSEAGGKTSPRLALWHTGSPTAPSLIAPSAGAAGQLLAPTLQWSSVAEANTYRVEVSANSRFSPNIINQGGLVGTSYTVPAGQLVAGITYYWRVRAVNVNGESNPSNSYLFTTTLPQTILLDQNYPNPFNPSTRIRFGLPEDLMVKLEIYDVIGRKVLSVADGFMRAGMHEYPVHLEGLPSGTYWYVLKAGNVQKVRRMTFIR